MSGIAPKSNLDNGGLTAEEQKDLLGQDYTFICIEVSLTKRRGSGSTKRMIFLSTGSKLKDLGIIS